MSSCRLLFSIAAIALCCLETIKVADATGFLTPFQNQDTFVNRSDSVTLQWSYQIDNPSEQYSIQCGYRLVTPDWIVKKQNTQPAAVVSKWSQRASLSVDANNVIGFKVTGIQFSDAGNMGCQLIYKLDTFFYSKLYTLKIYERPRFIDCLGPIGTRFELNEGQAINTTCIFYGNPQPSLQCEILDGAGRRQPNFISPTTTNFTGPNRLLLSDVRRYAAIVKCVASHQATGKVEQIRTVMVYYVPTIPLQLTLLQSTDSMISITWLMPKESGNRIINSYYLETEHPQSLFRNGTNYTILGSSPKLQYNFRYLQPKIKYTIRVYAQNLVGRGPAAAAIYETIPYTNPAVAGTRTGSSNAGLIAGVVIGVVALIAIIICVAVYLYKRQGQDKKYPTSYVEEGVDYPPADASMYAHVNKKNHLSQQEQYSTSGYPDIIHQAKSKSMGNPYEEKALRSGSQDDVSTSPSYENSKKEYV